MSNLTNIREAQPARQVPPGPKGYPLVGLIPRLMRDMMGTYREAAQIGGIVEMDLGMQRAYLLTDPELIKHVLLDNYRNYVKGEQLDSIRPLLGNGLFSARATSGLRSAG